MIKNNNKRPLIITKNFVFLIILVLISVLFFIFPSKVYSYEKKPFISPLNGDVIVKFRQIYFDPADKVERRHTGIDLAGRAGTRVSASGNGFVSYIGYSPIGGRTVVIKHNDKIRTTYLNLEQINVSLGSYIKQGESIATTGANDDPSSEETHLHFGIIYDGKYLNPEDVLAINYKSITKFISLEYIKPDFGIKFN